MLKRAIKTPKVYFRDTGLATHLTRWLTPDTLYYSHESYPKTQEHNIQKGGIIHERIESVLYGLPQHFSKQCGSSQPRKVHTALDRTHQPDRERQTIPLPRTLGADGPL